MTTTRQGRIRPERGAAPAKGMTPLGCRENRRDSDLITVLSHNVWAGRAQNDLAGLVRGRNVDLLCLQEATTSTLPDRIADLDLVVATRGNRLGVAVYARADRFATGQSQTFTLPRSLHDRVAGSTGERLAGMSATDRRTGRQLLVGSLHATPLTDVNYMRRRQIDNAHLALRTLGTENAMLMIGDFNYPLFTRRLARHLGRTGFELSRTATGTYHGRGPIRGTFDLATTSGLDVVAIDALDHGASDHAPLLITVAFA